MHTLDVKAHLASAVLAMHHCSRHIQAVSPHVALVAVQTRRLLECSATLHTLVHLGRAVPLFAPLVGSATVRTHDLCVRVRAASACNRCAIAVLRASLVRCLTALGAVQDVLCVVACLACLQQALVPLSTLPVCRVTALAASCVVVCAVAVVAHALEALGVSELIKYISVATERTAQYAETSIA
jgi:hypothetical protein